MAEQIQKATGNSLRFAFDTISDATSQSVCVKSLSSTPEGSAAGKVVTIQGPSKEAQALRSDVVIQRECRNLLSKDEVLTPDISALSHTHIHCSWSLFQLRTHGPVPGFGCRPRAHGLMDAQD